MKTVVYWRVNNQVRLESCKRIGLHSTMNVNGESEYNIDGQKLEEVRELEKQGIIQITREYSVVAKYQKAGTQLGLNDMSSNQMIL